MHGKAVLVTYIKKFLFQLSKRFLEFNALLFQNFFVYSSRSYLVKAHSKEDLQQTAQL